MKELINTCACFALISLHMFKKEREETAREAAGVCVCVRDELGDWD